MTDDFITISAGAASFTGDDGVYVLTLTDISEPRQIFPQRGPNAGKEVNLRDWTFAFEDGQTITEGASTASGPKSKTFAWLTALLGGQPPQIGTQLSKAQLLGRMALGTIRKDESGWPRLVNLSAMPAQMLAQQVAAATGAPVAAQPAAPVPVAQPQPVAAATPVQQPVAPAVASSPASPKGDALPF